KVGAAPPRPSTATRAASRPARRASNALLEPTALRVAAARPEAADDVGVMSSLLALTRDLRLRYAGLHQRCLPDRGGLQAAIDPCTRAPTRGWRDARPARARVIVPPWCAGARSKSPPSCSACSVRRAVVTTEAEVRTRARTERARRVT